MFFQPISWLIPVLKKLNVVLTRQQQTFIRERKNNTTQIQKPKARFGRRVRPPAWIGNGAGANLQLLGLRGTVNEQVSKITTVSVMMGITISKVLTLLQLTAQ